MHPCPFIIWDVGLGAAANAIAVIEALREVSGPVQLHSFERDLGALDFALHHSSELPYLIPHVGTIRTLLEHGEANTGSVHWTLHEGNFRALLQSIPLPSPHAILFDPYSPASNPELWSLEAFQALHRRLSPTVPCLLTNYTRSTAIRVALLLAGFYVGHGNAVAEKDQTTVASNTLSLLLHPLDTTWLQRAFRSTRSAPPRDGQASGYPISEKDWQTLISHSQFR
jgi:tRNA U34 5-methylaminomethyl-2-thiouridine-forming methyltransferase MnmC